MSAQTSAGTGSGHDAAVRTGPSTAELEAMLAESRERDAIEAPLRRIANLELKVAQFKAHLAETEAALALERAAQKGGN